MRRDKGLPAPGRTLKVGEPGQQEDFSTKDVPTTDNLLLSVVILPYCRAKNDLSQRAGLTSK
jgi:hypothetical protein